MYSVFLHVMEHCHVQVEVTYFEDLEETHAEVKLRQSLWLAQKEWESDYETWMEVNIGFILWHTEAKISNMFIYSSSPPFFW